MPLHKGIGGKSVFIVINQMTYLLYQCYSYTGGIHSFE